MDLRSLKYVLAIARFQNLTKAADALYVGQPTLSKFLAALEDELGLKLFRKLGNRYVLTYAGERYVEKAEKILLMVDDLESEMADILKRDVGVLNFAFAYMRCSYMLPKTLPAFHEKYPNVKTVLFEGRSDDNDKRLLDGQIDVAFYSRPSETNPLIDYHTLAKEELLLCTCGGHPLGKKARKVEGSTYPVLDLSAIAEERVILMQPSQRTRQIVDAILQENHIQLKDTFYTTSIQAIMGLVAAGHGVSFIFEPHLKNRLDTRTIDCYSIGPKPFFGEFVAATRKGSYISHYTQAYIDIVREVANRN